MYPKTGEPIGTGPIDVSPNPYRKIHTWSCETQILVMVKPPVYEGKVFTFFPRYLTTSPPKSYQMPKKERKGKAVF